MSILDKHKVEDRNTREAIKEVEKIAKGGEKGNFKVVEKPLDYNDIVNMEEGKRYITPDTNNPNNKIISTRIGNDIFETIMVKKSK